MTVLPYVVISIIASLGSLSVFEARRLGVRAGLVLIGLWAIGLAFALLLPVVFPHLRQGSFFSTSMLERPPAFDFVDLYIPSNPFNSLANNIVPAVVLFSIVLGVALI
jgi:Na+/H+-dicarboxylate symporter